MISIPQLKGCCCGCTLRTGSIIIGWLSLIVIIVPLFMASYSIFLWLAFRGMANSKERASDDRMFLAAAGYCAIQITSSILLLMGAYQNKKCCLVWHIFTSLFNLIVFLIPSAILLAIKLEAVHATLMILLIALLLYFDLVVYSLYREIKINHGGVVHDHQELPLNTQ